MSVAAKVSAELLRKACLIPGMRLPTLLGEFAASLEAHPRLCRAAADDKEFMSAAISTFDAAAVDDNTYSDAMCVSQLAVAQRRLNLPCERFWRELERREHIGLGARGLANVYHAYAALAQQRKAAGAAASDALCSKLEERGAALVGDFAPQGAANCLWAVATLERRLEGPLRAELLAAMQRTAPHMNPQAVANIMWAFAKLECTPDSECLAALLSAVQRTTAYMKPQEVSNTLWAFVRLDCKPDGQCFAALLAAAERSAPSMNPQMLQTACGPLPSSTPRRWRARCCRRLSARRRA